MAANTRTKPHPRAARRKPEDALQEQLQREHELLTTIVDNVDMVIVSCDAKGRFTLVNRAAREMRGEPPSGRGRSGMPFRFLSPQTHQPISANDSPLNRALVKGEAVDEELLVEGADGRLHYVLAHGRPLRAPDGTPNGAVIVSYDHTELVETERQHRELMDALPVLIAYIDCEERYRYVNRGYEELWRQPREAIVGKTLREFLGEEMYSQTAEPIKRALAGEVVKYEEEFATPDAPRYLQVTLVPDRDSSGAVAGLHTMVQDITETKRLELELRRTANHDALTGLPNRRYLLDWLVIDMAVARRRQPSLFVLFIDLDGFKAVNDGLGHDAGDAVLVAVAECLRECLRESDFIARFGGDEFVAILTNSPSEEELDHLMKRVLQRMSGPLVEGIPPGAISASIGVARFPGDGNTPDELIQAADRAMYRAKSCGKGCFCIRRPERPESDPEAWHCGFFREEKPV